MSRRCKGPLHALTPEKRKELRRLIRSHGVPATAVDRARALPRLPMGPVTPPPAQPSIETVLRHKTVLRVAAAEDIGSRQTSALTNVPNAPIVVRTARASPPDRGGHRPQRQVLQLRLPGALSKGLHPSRQRR